MADLTPAADALPPAPLQHFEDGGYEASLDQSEIVRRYLVMLIRRKWLIAAVVLTVLAAAAVQSFTTTPVYTASAQIQIDLEPLNILPYQDVSQTPSFYYEETYQQTQHRILQSKILARRVVQKLRLHQDPAFKSKASRGVLREAVPWLTRRFGQLFSGSSSHANQQPSAAPRPAPDEVAASALAGRVTVTPDKGTRLVTLSYSCENPELAARIVNALADEYLEFNLETRVKAATLATEFLETELEQLQVKVEKSETALVEYARKHGIVEAGENSNRENIVLQKLADLNAEMTKVQAELIAHTVRYENSRGADVENFPESLETPAIKQLQARLSELKEKHASLSGRYGPEHIEFAQLERQLLELEAQLAKEKQAALEKVRQDYHLALDHYRSIARALEEQKQLAAKLSEDSIQYNILKREVDSNKQLYDGLLQRLKQAGVSAGLRSSNLHILERASIPGSPSAPRHSRNLLLGALLGLMLGVGLAFGLDYFDDSIKTPDELEQSARLPALGMIPTMRQAGAAHHAALPPSSQDETKPAALPFPQDVGFWEAYRTLRTSLLLSHSDKPPRILLVTSAAPGEGKTTTAINLAISLAQTGARTLLVDLEMRKPEVAGRLRLNDTQGMSLFLSGNSSLSSQIVQTPYDNLFVIPAGPPPPNPAELIGSKRWRKALVLLRDYFQHVVIDSPPVLSVADPLIISRQVDGVVLVVRAGKTPREAVRKARRALDTVGATVLGAIINGVDLKNAEYSYYYRHYYAYEYYSRGRQG